MKKVKNKKAIFTHSSGPQRNLKQLFYANSKSKIIDSEQGSNGTYLTHLYFSPKAAYLERLYGIKIMGIQEIKNLTLGHL
jgi:hypothetical protein